MNHHGKAPTEAEGRSPYPEAAITAMMESGGRWSDNTTRQLCERWLRAALSALSTSDLLSLVQMSDEERDKLTESMKSLRIFADGLSRHLSDAAYRNEKQPRHDERMATDCAFLIGALNRVEESLTTLLPDKEGDSVG